MLILDKIQNQLPERRFQRHRSTEELDDERIGEDIGVFGVGREPMIGARKGDFKKANGRGWRDCRAEFLDIERCTDKGDGVACLLLYMKS